MNRADEIKRIKDKLKKLMAKEESARELGNQAEADAFASKINQLLIDYELEVSELQGERHVYGIGEEIISTLDLTVRNESDWVRRLYSACAPTNFCQVLFHGKDIYRVILIGDETNREFVHYMVAQLVNKLRHLARSDFSAYKKSGGHDKRNTYIRAFLKGACISIRQRLAEDMQARERANNQVHGLVLAKDKALSDYMGEKYPRVGFAKMRSGSSADGYHNGKAAGRKVSINDGLNKGNRGHGGQKLIG